MKALQYESETTSPKDMHKGKERNEKNESVTISPPKGPAKRLVQSWLGWWSQTSSIGWWGKFQRSGGRNPWNTKSVVFLLTQVYICPGSFPVVGGFTLSDIILGIMGHFGSPLFVLECINLSNTNCLKTLICLNSILPYSSYCEVKIISP